MGGGRRQGDSLRGSYRTVGDSNCSPQDSNNVINVSKFRNGVAVVSPVCRRDALSCCDHARARKCACTRREEGAKSGADHCPLRGQAEAISGRSRLLERFRADALSDFPLYKRSRFALRFARANDGRRIGTSKHVAARGIPRGVARPDLSQSSEMYSPEI